MIFILTLMIKININFFSKQVTKQVLKLTKLVIKLFKLLIITKTIHSNVQSIDRKSHHYLYLFSDTVYYTYIINIYV